MLWKIRGYGQLHLQPLVSSRWKNFLPLLDKWLEKAVGYLWLDYKVYWLEFYLHDYLHLLQRLGLSHITAHCKNMYLTIVKLCQYLGFTILSNQRLRNPYERNPIVAKAEMFGVPSQNIISHEDEKGIPHLRNSALWVVTTHSIESTNNHGAVTFETWGHEMIKSENEQLKHQFWASEAQKHMIGHHGP